MPAKEELTQVEKDKLHFGFDFDFREIAKRPAESFTPNELAMFKWTGIYQQLQKGFFMKGAPLLPDNRTGGAYSARLDRPRL